jgi:hypothetical protein
MKMRLVFGALTVGAAALAWRANPALGEVLRDASDLLVSGALRATSQFASQVEREQ